MTLLHPSDLARKPKRSSLRDERVELELFHDFLLARGDFPPADRIHIPLVAVHEDFNVAVDVLEPLVDLILLQAEIADEPADGGVRNQGLLPDRVHQVHADLLDELGEPHLLMNEQVDQFLYHPAFDAPKDRAKVLIRPVLKQDLFELFRFLYNPNECQAYR